MKPFSPKDKRPSSAPSADIIAIKRAEIAARYAKPGAPRDYHPSQLRVTELLCIRAERVAMGFPVDNIDLVLDHPVLLDVASMTGHELGRLLGFTFSEYKLIGKVHGRHPATIRPCNASEEAIQAYRRVANRPKQTAAVERLRDRRAAAAIMRVRAAAVIKALTEHPMTVTALMRVAGSAAFRRPDGEPLAGNSLRVIILRTFREPIMAKVLVVEDRQRKPGLVERVVRLVADPDAGRRH